MPHKSIAIVVAMRRELASLVSDVRGQRLNGLELFELENAAIVVGGIGSKAARQAAKSVIENYQPTMLVSAGLAGALIGTLKAGDVVRASEVADAETGARFRTAGGESVIVTVSSVSGPMEKHSLAERYEADVVDMESAAVAAVAREHGIEFAAIKAISDELNFEMPPLARFVDEEGKFATTRFAAYLAVRPQWWLSVRRLEANSKLASMNLSHAVKHLMSQHAKNQQEEKISQV